MIDCQVCVLANGKTSAHLKSVFKMSTMCSNASSKTWMPVPDHFIDDHLVEMFPLSDQARLQLVDVMCGTHAPAASPKSDIRHIAGHIRDYRPSQSLDCCKTLTLLNQSLADIDKTKHNCNQKHKNLNNQIRKLLTCAKTKKMKLKTLDQRPFTPPGHEIDWAWSTVASAQPQWWLTSLVNTKQSKDITDTRVYDTFRQGLSVCAPIMENPPPGLYCPPTANAIRVDWLRVTKHWTHCHRTQLVVFFIHHNSVDKQSTVNKCHVSHETTFTVSVHFSLSVSNV